MKEQYRHDRELKKLWLRQLQLEYDDICWSYGLQLKMPVFEISEAKNELGAWCQETRTLRLSSQLIRNHAWSVTIQVLKHEMAHQLCSEGTSLSKKGHGENFQRACGLLGVLMEFRASGTLLPEAVEEISSGLQLTEQGRRCIVKIEKLLALAGSANEHEANLAMQKANKLIEKYNINSLKSGKEQSYASHIIDEKKKQIATYQRHLCRIVQDFFFVKVVMASLYDPLRNETYKTIEILGTRENVIVAEYCYSFLDKKLHSLWQQNRKRFSGVTKTEKNSYFLGLLRGVYEKLQEQRQKNRSFGKSSNTDRDLVCTSDPGLDDFVGMRFPRLQRRKTAGRGTKIYRSTFNEGQETGKKITLNKGLSGDRVDSGKYLTLRC